MEQNNKEVREQIFHINPNCIDSRYCEPHGELGEVMYRGTNVKLLLSSHNQKLLEQIEGLRKTHCNLGGFGHSHDPFNCGEKKCIYCEHMDKGECKNPMSYEDTEMYNQALDDIKNLLTKEI